MALPTGVVPLSLKTRVRSLTTTFPTWLHRVTDTKTVSTNLIYLDQVDDFLIKFSHIYGDRVGRVSVTVPMRFFDAKIGNIVELTRSTMPGPSTSKFMIVGITRDKDRVILVLDDLKAVKENIGDF